MKEVEILDKVFSEQEMINLYNTTRPDRTPRKPRGSNTFFPPFTRVTPDGYFVAVEKDTGKYVGHAGWKKLDGNTFLTTGSLTLPEFRKRGINRKLYDKRAREIIGGSPTITITSSDSAGFLNMVESYTPRVTIDALPKKFQQPIIQALEYYAKAGKNARVYYRGDNAMQKAWSILKTLR